MLCWWVSWTAPQRLPASPPPLHTTMFPCIALVMPFSRDSLTKRSMTLVRFSGAKSLRDPVASRLLGEWVPSSPLARARWSEATEVGYPSLICNKPSEGGRARSGPVLVCDTPEPPPPPRVLKDGSAGSATNKCP